MAPKIPISGAADAAGWAVGGYEDSLVHTGDLAGAAEDALDTARGLYLGDPTTWA